MTKSQERRKTAPARILIADDHDLARIGLRSMLEHERQLDLVGEATNGREAVDMCRTLRPDLALLDVRMPELDGLAATRLIKQEVPTTRVIIVTMHESPEYLLEALKAGATGYLLKDASRQEMLDTVYQALRGESRLSGELAVRMIQRLAAEMPPQPHPSPERLTPREYEVLRLLAQGQTNREIAASLNVSAGTIKIHVEHIIAKLGVSDRTQAAVRAVSLGLV